MDITGTQRAILALIADRIEAEGVPPSQTEIARAMGFSSVRAAQYHLEALEQAGAIQRMPGRARAIRLCASPTAIPEEMPVKHVEAANAPEGALHLPVLGQVAAAAVIDRFGLLGQKPVHFGWERIVALGLLVVALVLLLRGD